MSMNLTIHRTTTTFRRRGLKQARNTTATDSAISAIQIEFEYFLQVVLHRIRKGQHGWTVQVICGDVAVKPGFGHARKGSHFVGCNAPREGEQFQSQSFTHLNCDSNSRRHLMKRVAPSSFSGLARFDQSSNQGLLENGRLLLSADSLLPFTAPGDAHRGDDRRNRPDCLHPTGRRGFQKLSEPVPTTSGHQAEGTDKKAKKDGSDYRSPFMFLSLHRRLHCWECKVSPSASLVQIELSLQCANDPRDAGPVRAAVADRGYWLAGQVIAAEVDTHNTAAVQVRLLAEQVGYRLDALKQQLLQLGGPCASA